MEDGNKPIYLYIYSPGGSVTAGLAIYDTIQYVRQVVTICGAAARWERSCWPPALRARVFSPQPDNDPTRGNGRRASDIEIEAEIPQMKEMLNRSLSDMSGQVSKRSKKIPIATISSVPKKPRTGADRSGDLHPNEA